MALQPRCYISGSSASASTFAPGLTGWTNAGAGVSGTAPVAGDLVSVWVAIATTGANMSLSSGTGAWTFQSASIQSTAGFSSQQGTRAFDGTETAPTFTVASVAVRFVWYLVAFAPDTGDSAALDVFSTVKQDTTAATTHTPNSAAASGTDAALEVFACFSSATGTTTLAGSASSGFTALPAVTATAASAKSVGLFLAYAASQTGTVAPGAANAHFGTSTTANANDYLMLVKETVNPVAQSDLLAFC